MKMKILINFIALYVPLYLLLILVIANAEDFKPRYPEERTVIDPNDFMSNHKESSLPSAYRQHPQYHNHPPMHDHPPYYPNNPPHYHNHPPYSHTRFDHNPDFHRGQSQNSQSEENSDSASSSSFNEETCCSEQGDFMGRNGSLEIPIDFIQTINKYSVNDLLLMNLIDGDVDEDKEVFLTSRFGDQERSAASIPKAAGCSPEIRTIQLKVSDDPTILYIPQCTKVPQCGGCCSHSLLSCQPNQTETLAYQVLKTQYNGNKKLRLLGKEMVGVEKHITCHCACKIKEEVARANCNAYQEYRANECRCVCTNNDEEKKCYKNYNKKLWDPELCACQCRDILQCSSGYSFDQRECKCVPTPMRRRNAATTDFPFLEDSSDEE